jgi:hypothetical protein
LDYLVEDGGTQIMVEIGVEVVDADGIHPWIPGQREQEARSDIRTQPLHQGGISKTHIAIAQRVDAAAWFEPGRPAWLVGDADELEAVARLRVDKIGALDLNALDGSSKLCAQREDLNLKNGQLRLL